MGMDPVVLFLAMAFADRAFLDDITPETLLRMQASQTAKARWFEWKPNIQNLPIIRQNEKNGGISEWRGMTYATLLREF